MYENPKHGLMNSVLLVTLINVLGLGLAFISNIVIAAKFGAGRDMDVYVAAGTLPLYITSILASVLNFTFIPVCMEYRAKQNAEIESVMVSSVLNIAVLATSFLAVLGMVFAHPIMKLLTPGFSSDKLAVSTNLLQWMMPIIVLTAINELLSSVYFANKKFILPLLNKIFSPFIIVAFVLLFANSLSTKSLVLASLTTLLVQLGLLVLGFVKSKTFSYLPVMHYFHPWVKKIFILMVPMILGMMMYRTMPMIDRFFASGLPEGAISHLNYASKMLNFIVSIITFGISLASFSLLSHLVAEKRWSELKQNLSRIIRFILFLSIPISIIMGIYGRHIIQLFFEHGKFFSTDTSATALALSIYLLALPMSCIGTIIGQVYYAMQDTITPAIMGIFEIVMYIMATFLLFPHYGFLAMPIASVLYFSFATINVYLIRKKLGGTGGSKILQSCFVHFGMALLAAAMIYYPVKLVSGVLWKNVFIGLAFVVYVVCSRYLMKSEEAKIFLDRVTLYFHAH